MGEVARRVDTLEQCAAAVGWVEDLLTRGLQAGPVVVTLGRPQRTLDQNRRMWAMLTDVAQQVEWHGRWLTAEDWKHVFTAALHAQKAVPGLDGGFVVCGKSTRTMNKAELSDLMELIEEFGAKHNIKFDAQGPSEPRGEAIGVGDVREEGGA